jgi:hypothetical protein
MKFSVFCLLLLVSCQESKKVPETTVEKVSPVDEESNVFKEAFVLSTNVKGLQLSGENLSKQGNLTTAEDLKVIQTEGEKTIDEFPLFEYGPVGFVTEESQLKVIPKKDILEINYVADESGKIQRSAKCEFKSKPDQVKLKTILAAGKVANPDWEGIFSDIFDLATEGDKGAYNFLMNPDAEAKTYLKHSDGAASTGPMVKVLKFMKDNGCKW